jgi:hypothetical protein
LCDVDYSSAFLSNWAQMERQTLLLQPRREEKEWKGKRRRMRGKKRRGEGGK